MKQFTLRRFFSDEDATLGVLLEDDKYPWLNILERPQRDNKNNISCIPDGTYLCKKVITEHHGETFTITGVAGRDAILFHWGNTEIDSKGCLILGLKWSRMDAPDPDSNQVELQPAVAESRNAFVEFMGRLHNDDSFILNIITLRR